MYEHVTPGTSLRIKAADYNGWQDAARAASQFNEAGNARRSAIEGGGVVLIRNDSGSVVEQFGILGITGVAINETDNLGEFKSRVMLTGDTPDIDDHVGRFVVALEPIPDGAIGRAALDGAWPCQVSMATAGDKWAEVKNADLTQLLSKSTTGSVKILYAPTGTGTKWCVVRLGDASPASIFPVTMTQTGGTAGTAAAQCSFTYTVATLGGASLGTAVAPITAPHTFARPALGKTTAATAGLACYVVSSGSLVLSMRWCNEVPARKECVTP